MRSIVGATLTRSGSIMATASSSADPRHVDEFPRARHCPDGHLDQGRLAPCNGLPQRPAQFVGTARAVSRRAETFGEFDKIGVCKVARNQAITELLLLNTADIAKRTVNKNDRYQRDPVTHCGRYLIAGVKKAAVAVDRDDGGVRP